MPAFHTQVALEEEWGDWLVSQRQASLIAVAVEIASSRLCSQVDAAINHYIEAWFAASLLSGVKRDHRQQDQKQ